MKNNKAIARGIKISQLIEILKKFKNGDHIDIEINEIDGKPATLTIRQKNVEEEGSEEIDKEILDHLDNYSENGFTQNPKISENIPYKDLLDNLN